MPSFSSTRSLMREMVSSDSMSISISLPVRVFTLICAHPRQESGAHQQHKKAELVHKRHSSKQLCELR